MSITNFDDITEDLTEVECLFKDDIHQLLKKFLRDEKIIKQETLVELINLSLEFDQGEKCFKITPVKLRKYFNYFRVNGILPIIGTSKGCFISYKEEDILDQIDSLNERANQIYRAAEGMKKFL